MERELARLAKEIEAARAEGYATGYAAGEQARGALETARIANAVERLADVARRLLSTMDEDRTRLEAEAVELAIATARILAKGLVEREPLHEITRLVHEALNSLRNAPHLVLRVAPDLVEPIDARIKRLGFERGYDGRMIVLGDPDLPPGDCHIEWADGGMSRSRRDSEAAIARAVQRYIEARAAGEPE
jgi:flagellar assembly protein FliH